LAHSKGVELYACFFQKRPLTTTAQTLLRCRRGCRSRRVTDAVNRPAPSPWLEWLKRGLTGCNDMRANCYSTISGAAARSAGLCVGICFFNGDWCRESGCGSAGGLLAASPASPHANHGFFGGYSLGTLCHFLPSDSTPPIGGFFVQSSPRFHL
jgi:hypothetical protein